LVTGQLHGTLLALAVAEIVGRAQYEQHDRGRVSAERPACLLARKAAAAALRFGPQQAGLRRIIAVAPENNFASRMALGSISMTECDSSMQSGYRIVMYENITDRKLFTGR
jgi:hypothetical protein